MSTVLRCLQNLLYSPMRLFALFGIACGYALLYLWLTGDIAGGGGGWQAVFPAWSRLLEMRGPFQFEPVGLLMLGSLVWTFSPINTLLALVVGVLLGFNLLIGWRLWHLPRRCSLRGSNVGVLAVLPGLLVGGACCAPLLLIWLGLPIAGAVAGVAPLFLPLALFLLSIGLWLGLRQLSEHEESA